MDYMETYKQWCTYEDFDKDTKAELPDIVMTTDNSAKEYNRYKVYRNNVTQVLPPHSTGSCSVFEALHEVRLIEQVI